ncbi:hypothetical protein SKAU_G00024370 [Synaphobranchus kaupii]|uniref:Uncharacterized protein n=1 Tax=Synaphobranchus kaupii TaxID=118154 RepID=A0A9Q1JEZ7_SYNKA|nr:hypothetical protein SKAU_G00024370 [Synaphobranchus kaupii]
MTGAAQFAEPQQSEPSSDRLDPAVHRARCPGAERLPALPRRSARITAGGVTSPPAPGTAARSRGDEATEGKRRGR